jgi:hypothetical protein
VLISKRLPFHKLFWLPVITISLFTRAITMNTAIASRPDAQPLDVQATVRPWSIVPISKILLVPFLKGGLSMDLPGRPIITIGHLVYHEESSEVRVVSNSSQLTFSLHGRRWAEETTRCTPSTGCVDLTRGPCRIQPRLMYLDTFTKGNV